MKYQELDDIDRWRQARERELDHTIHERLAAVIACSGVSRDLAVALVAEAPDIIKASDDVRHRLPGADVARVAEGVRIARWRGQRFDVVRDGCATGGPCCNIGRYPLTAYRLDHHSGRRRETLTSCIPGDEVEWMG